MISISFESPVSFYLLTKGRERGNTYVPGSCWEFKVNPRTSLNNLRVSPLISNIFRRYDAQKFPFEIYVLTFNETYDMYLRHVSRSENLGGRAVLGGDNVPPPGRDRVN